MSRMREGPKKRYLPPLRSQDCVLITRVLGLLGREQVPLDHPAVGVLEHFARIRLEYDPLTWAESARVGDGAQILGHLAQPVVLVALGLQIDIALGAA